MFRYFDSCCICSYSCSFSLQMREAADEDRQLNARRQPATKKSAMLDLAMSQINKTNLIEGFLDANVLSALTDWLAPMPDRSLPAVKIREAVTKWLLSVCNRCTTYLWSHTHAQIHTCPHANAQMHTYPHTHAGTNFHAHSPMHNNHRTHMQMCVMYRWSALFLLHYFQDNVLIGKFCMFAVTTSITRYVEDFRHWESHYVSV